MIEMVSCGSATMEVTLKHSGSLFMYAGHLGGAYSKNSFGNIYTAVGVFVLDRMFREAWGNEAPRKQAEFNDVLEKKRINISMELVTAVLGDHGQRPNDDYAVVIAVTELGHGKPRFYSTPQVIAFCLEWRLPTNHVWLFSTSQMENWGTSVSKQKELCKLLDEWAVYITSKCGNKPPSSSTYLSEAEPFLEQYAKANQDLIGATGDLVQPSSPTTSLQWCFKTRGPYRLLSWYTWLCKVCSMQGTIENAWWPW
uniref:Uncharacterized protein n=1 Tax=Triticum urartu TaxID=4572 RepID=A0A8R7P8H3_TRIUA